MSKSSILSLIELNPEFLQGKSPLSEKKGAKLVPKKLGGSVDVTTKQHVKNLATNIPVKPPAINSIKAKSKEVKHVKPTPLSDQSFLCQGSVRVDFEFYL